MTKEKFKTFVKDHKREIIIGTIVIVGTVCTIVGVKGINRVRQNRIKAYKEAIEGLNEFNNALCEAMSDCSNYVPVTYDEVCRAAANGHLMKNCWSDPDGSVIEIKKFIAFGNKVEP